MLYVANPCLQVPAPLQPCPGQVCPEGGECKRASASRTRRPDAMHACCVFGTKHWKPGGPWV